MCILPELRQLQNKTRLQALPIASFVVSGGPTHSGCGVWPKAAVMNVSLQQQMSIHNSCGLIRVYSRIAFGQSIARDSAAYILDQGWKEEMTKKRRKKRLFKSQGCTEAVNAQALWVHLLQPCLNGPLLTALLVSDTEYCVLSSFFSTDGELQHCALFLTTSELSIASWIRLSFLRKSAFSLCICNTELLHQIIPTKSIETHHVSATSPTITLIRYEIEIQHTDHHITTHSVPFFLAILR